MTDHTSTLIIGANGQLAKAMQQQYPSARAVGHNELDLCTQQLLQPSTGLALRQSSTLLLIPMLTVQKHRRAAQQPGASTPKRWDSLLVSALSETSP